MAKIFRVLILAAALMLISQTSALAGAQDFAIVNNTGSTIHHIFCSRADTNNWEEDVLGETGVIAPGEYATITFNAAERGQYWDFRVVFDNGADLYWEDIDLLSVSVITVNSDGTADFE